jgi:sortase A
MSTPTLEERMTPRTGDDERPPKRSRLRDVMHAFSTVLIVSGVLLLADAGLTVVWQEPLSAIYNHFQQNQLSGQLDDEIETKLAPTPLEKKALRSLPDARSRIAFAARALDRKIKTGQPIGRIRIKAIGVDKVVVEGTSSSVLPKGPGHYPATPLPGAPGTVAFAGHRTTYGAPFRQVDKLDKGDVIELDMPYAKVTYAVERLRIVKPTDTWVTERKGYNRLVLTACHPLYSAAQRIVVFARQVTAEPSRSLY